MRRLRRSGSPEGAHFAALGSGDSFAVLVATALLLSIAKFAGAVPPKPPSRSIEWPAYAHTGAPANRGVALIGEFTYRDGCDGDRQKGGTFSLWSGKRVTTHLARR